MAEEKRELTWIQTAFFMGWGCSACNWRDFIPRDVPTLVSPSNEAWQAFNRHSCAKPAVSNRVQPNLLVQPPV
jgi:hypothetical protein